MLASQGLGSQVAAVNVLPEHDELFETVYPESQVGWQVEPDTNALVQSPTAPFEGGVLASQQALVNTTLSLVLSSMSSTQQDP